MIHRTRDSDKDPDVQAILRQRNGNGKETRKILFLIIMILLGISGFFGTRWISSQELTDVNMLEKAKIYTDGALILYDAKVNPYLQRIKQNEVIVRNMALNIERITAFMEYKFGMERKRREP